MDTLVTCEHVGGDEAFQTQGAGEEFVAGVDGHVSRQLVIVQEQLPTNL